MAPSENMTTEVSPTRSFTAAVPMRASGYALTAKFSSAVITSLPGGETATGGLIENYPGYLEIDGGELMAHMMEQVEKYGVTVLNERVDAISRHGDCFEVVAGDATFEGTAAVLAVGRERRELGLPNEDEWTGRGVSSCATCDALLFRGKVAALVGGGDAAVKGAVLLGKYADKVYIIYRGSEFTRPEPANLQRLEQSSNVETIFEANIIELKGKYGQSGVVLDRQHDGAR